MPVVPPPVIALGFAGLQHAVAPETGAGIVRKAAAAAVAAASAGLLAGTVREFVEAGTTVEPFHPEKARSLVTTGPNRISRNPMYVGMAGLLAAHAIARGGVLPLLPVAAFVGVIDVAQIRPEEKALRDVFGIQYAAYERTVRRWL